MKRAAIGVFAFLVLAGMIGFVVTRGGIGGIGGGGGAAAIGAPTEAKDAVGGGSNRVAQAAPVSESAGGGAVPGDALGSVGAIPGLGQKIVKTGQIELTVKKGTFDDRFTAATLVAVKYGGYVTSSSQAGTKVRSGTIVIRVPNISFEQARKDLLALGAPTGQSVSGEDVTAQFVDLQARLRTWEAQEAVLLRLMDRATSIEATLRVQRELQDVQLRIEQIKGAFRVLDNQTAFATIQLSMREPGAPVVGKQHVASNRPSLAKAWNEALDGFLGVLYTVIVGLGYLLPISVIVASAWLIYRRTRISAAPRAS